ncbi:MAG: SDR family NAD(P)-dependent oxidoreductase [Deltaproteobacteria bacterium]|nr:SDR family NAD(P)-dependent oxidoreductase [Deltaproteobacteria bacterium]
MRVLLTGGAGFLGGHCLQRFLRAGHEVVVVDTCDDQPTPRAQKLATLAAATALGPVSHLALDVRARDAIVDAVGRADIVVHLAALPAVMPSMARPLDYAAVNVAGTAAMLEAALRLGARRVVLASSSSVYGEMPGAQREDDPAIAPESPYGASKRAGELLAHAWSRGAGIGVTALRFFTVYGPGQRPDMAVHTFMRQVAAGEPVHARADAGRDFVHATDAARAVELAALRTTPGLEIFNVGSGVTTPLATLVEMIGRALGRAPILGADLAPWAGDVAHTHADPERAARELGFRATIDLAQGLASAWAWQRQLLGL